MILGTPYTPMQIMWCLTFYTSSSPISQLGQEHFNSPAGKEVYLWMQREKLITKEDEPTDRLEAFVEFLCETPLPVCKWVRP